MLRDMTLGQYYAVDSVIHRLDPRFKIVAVIAYLVALFFVDGMRGFAVAAVFLGIVIALSKVPLSYILRGLTAVFVLIALTFTINLFLIKGGAVLWQWHFLSITEQGARTAVFMAVRLVLLIIGSSLLTFTTKPISLTDGIESLLSPLKRFGVPSHDMAMMMSIALRFIPTLMEEADKVMKAQTARGADFESGKLKDRAKSLVPLLIPLFISAFRIAADLAMAMEARCYGGSVKRTRLHVMKLKSRDAAAAVVLCAFLAFEIIV